MHTGRVQLEQTCLLLQFNSKDVMVRMSGVITWVTIHGCRLVKLQLICLGTIQSDIQPDPMKI